MVVLAHKQQDRIGECDVNWHEEVAADGAILAALSHVALDNVAILVAMLDSYDKQGDGQVSVRSCEQSWETKSRTATLGFGAPRTHDVTWQIIV